jgi:hypothetical protein
MPVSTHGIQDGENVPRHDCTFTKFIVVRSFLANWIQVDTTPNVYSLLNVASRAFNPHNPGADRDKNPGDSVRQDHCKSVSNVLSGARLPDDDNLPTASPYQLINISTRRAT